MGVATDMRKLASERGDANLEFADGGYRLSLNPIESRFDELGFILWRDEAGGPVPVAVGRAVGDHLIFDDDPEAGAGGGRGNVTTVIASLIAGQPISVLGGGGNERAIPTAT